MEKRNEISIDYIFLIVMVISTIALLFAIIYEGSVEDSNISEMESVLVTFKDDVETKGTFSGEEQVELQRKLNDISNEVELKDIVKDVEGSKVIVHAQYKVSEIFGDERILDNQYLIIENIQVQ